MKKIGRMLAALLAAVLLCAAMGVLFAACGEGTEEPPQTDPVKVADGIDFDLAVGAEREFAVADYITTYGNAVSVSSADETVASAAVEDGVLTIAAVSSGKTDVTLTCGEVTVTFGVTVYERKAPVKVKDGEAIEIAFGGSAQRNVADYITTYGNAVSVSSEEAGTATAEVADGVLTIAAVSSGKTTVTLTCGDVTVTFAVTVALPEVEAPVFENGSISFDLFETNSGSYTFGITAPEGVSYTYAYSLAEQDGNAQISDGALTYTATEPVSKVLTVNVTATATVSGETIEKQGSFTVTITVTDTTPAVIESAIAADGTVDLYDHADGYTIDLTANIENAGNVTSYTVAVGDEEAAPVENAEEYVFTGSYSDTAQQVTLTVTALFGEKSVSYTYTLSVIDSTAYRLFNGGFETGNLTGWELTGDIGVVSQDSTYWNKPDHVYGKEGEYLFTWWSWDAQANEGKGDEVNREGNTGTLKSSAFTLRAGAIVSFLFGGGVDNEQIYLEFVNAETDEVLAKFFNTSPSDGRLVKYWYEFAEVSEDTQCYIRVTDNAKGGWGCFALDGVETYLAKAPAGYKPAVNQLSADV